ncbi:MAG: class I adenylate-forming enzyme family protein [Acidimicrobiales bacterium]
MTVRPTFVPTEADRYERPGGPWDVPTLDVATANGPRIVDGDRRVDADELSAMVSSLAGALANRGIGRGDIVAWQLPNWFETVVLYRASWTVGATAAPIHHQAGAGEVAHMVGQLDPTICFAAPGLPLGELAPADPVRDGSGVFDSLLSGGLTGEPGTEGVPVAGPSPSDVALVMFTSGSSGVPKGVIQTHRGLSYKMRLMVDVHRLGVDDVSLMPLPMAHVSGLLNGLLVPAAAGMTTVLMERWDPAVGLDLIERERVSFMVGPPPLFTALMDRPDFSSERVSSLRVLSTGAMGVSTEFVSRSTRELGAQVKRSFGSTELPTIATTLADDPFERSRDTDGRVVGEGELRTVDQTTGDETKAGEAGEVVYRGPEMLHGYLDPAATEATIRDGWFHTGDLGVLDDDGWLRIVGRLKDTIIRGGENIAPAEVEHVLEAHPGVRQAVVVGYPDPAVGERVAAFVVGDGVLDLAWCRAWFAEREVARFKVPELVVQLDAVPTLAAGKPDLETLRSEAARMTAAPR